MHKEKKNGREGLELSLTPRGIYFAVFVAAALALVLIKATGREIDYDYVTNAAISFPILGALLLIDGQM